MIEHKPYMTRITEKHSGVRERILRFLKKEKQADLQFHAKILDIKRLEKEQDTQEPTKILRFRTSERLVHWALAIPFLLCFSTAIVLVFFYNPDPLRPYRAVFSWTHKISGLFLMILPMLAIIRSRNDWRIYFYNIKQAWIWTIDDFKWVLLMGLAAINKKITLPEQGKFNAAEKINFMKLMSSYPFYILTGILIWLTDAAFLSWMIHFAMALLATPLVLGHLYMAMINPETRKGLDGMFSGFVDTHWAKHHYSKWYKEHFENKYGFGTGPTEALGGTHVTEEPSLSPTEDTAEFVTPVREDSPPEHEAEDTFPLNERHQRNLQRGQVHT